MKLMREITPLHARALRWFELNAGKTFAQRPFDVGLGIKLTSLQKGIWKPAGTKYALSVVQTHRGIYDDQDPAYFPDDTWRYFYHQQGKEPEDLRDPRRHYANVGLFECMADGIPVGVVIPAEDGVGYQVLGLATVESYRDGFFELVGPVALELGSHVDLGGASMPVTVAFIDTPDIEFDPHAEVDNRLKVITEVYRRQGAPRFRKALLSAYEGRCAAPAAA